jgi:sigma-B regulation protein RsbU (phosphoserine phosphatase)
VIEENTITLEPGDILIYYTDGVIEAMNRQREEFGEKRLKRVVQANHHLGSSAIYQALTKDIRQFVRDMPQKDDMTIVLVKRSSVN